MTEATGSTTPLSGWGRFPVLDCRLEHPADSGALRSLLTDSDSALARGNGRAYGDAALNPELTLSMLRMKAVHDFDPDTGLLICDAGVMLADILDRFVPRGWFPPVVPGTKFVTVGGMIAADVHGKNHEHAGSFGAHVESLSLMTADGSTRTCSRSENATLFRATLGGMGLTGIILSAAFRLTRIESSFVAAETLAANDLDETLDLFEASADWPYRVAWLDGLASGAARGRALFTRGRFSTRAELPPRLAEKPLRPAAPSRLRVPLDMPSWLPTRPLVRWFNARHYRSGRHALRTIPFDSFFFPLDRIRNWNRFHGRKGFMQYQCVVPKAESRNVLAALLERLDASGHGSFLSVLKRFGREGEGLLSFPMEGLSLALDLSVRPGLQELVADLDSVTHACGGRVYLAKDALSARESLHKGYPRLEAFDAVRREAASATTHFDSALSRRLGL